MSKQNDSDELKNNLVYTNGKLKLKIDGYSVDSNGSGYINFRSNSNALNVRRTFRGVPGRNSPPVVLLSKDLCPGVEITVECKDASAPGYEGAYWKCLFSEF